MLTSSSDAGDSDIFAYFTQPTATVHNVENDDLEPVWPYDLVSDVNSTLFSLATRTYNARAYKDNQDWSVDAIQAARLGLGSEVTARLQANIKTYQTYACGLSAWDTTKFTEPYIEESGVVAAAINEAVGTGFDGIIRLAPALPSSWSVSGTVFVQGQSKLEVQFQSGALAFGVLEAGSAGTVQIRNPWGTTAATIIDSQTQQMVSPSGNPMSFTAQAGHSYLIRKSSDSHPTTVQVTGTPATVILRRKWIARSRKMTGSDGARPLLRARRGRRRAAGAWRARGGGHRARGRARRWQRRRRGRLARA